MRDFTQEEKELIINTPIGCEDFTILGYKDDGTLVTKIQKLSLGKK